MNFVLTGQEQCYGVNSGFDLSPGQNDLMNRWNMELGDCCALCKRTAGCKAFVWGKVLRICYLKNAVGAKRADGNKVYGFPDASQDASGLCCISNIRNKYINILVNSVFYFRPMLRGDFRSGLLTGFARHWVPS